MSQPDIDVIQFGLISLLGLGVMLMAFGGRR